MSGANKKPVKTQNNTLKTGSSVSHSTHQKHDAKPEIFALLWLDPQVNKTEENRKAQEEFRQIINPFKAFDDQQRCHRYILSLSPQDRVFLIVNGQCGRQLVPHIFQLRQLCCIYVYCMNKQANEQWANSYPKVTSVIVQLDNLIEKIREDYKNQMRTEGSFPFTLFTTDDNSNQSTSELNGHFIHALLLVDVLIRMKSIDRDKKDLIVRFKKKYQNDTKELKLIHEFEREYSPDEALRWYTRNSFFYRMLNEALRMQDINMLFLFRFVIADIYQQLKQRQCKKFVRVFRGQVIPTAELKRIQQSRREFISVNSFFSSSMKMEIARGFLENAKNTDDTQRVLFIIDADPSVVTSRPFADITEVGVYSSEYEVLFMVGCIFRLNGISQDKDDGNIWKIKMKLCGDKENDLKNLFDHMKKDYGGGDGEVTLLSFGDVLFEMGQYELAEKMYYRLLDGLLPNDPSCPVLYCSLGLLSKAYHNYDCGRGWFLRSLKIYKETDPRNHINIGKLHNLIGEMWRMEGKLNTALGCYNDALEIFKNAHDENHLSMADVYNNIAIIYKNWGNYKEALTYYKTSLAIRRQHLPADHRDIAASHNNIGNVYLDLKDYDQAMQHHQKSFQIRWKSCPPQHPDIAKSYRNLGHVHRGKHEWKKANDSYKKAADIYRNMNPPNSLLLQIEEDINYVSSKLT